jgi:UDP-N-acetylmuramoylalanine--D-glutamate ligase
VSRVLVMGLGRFGGGAATARWFAARGDEVVATDLADESRLAATLESLADLPIRYRLGEHDPADFDRAEILAVNPAIPFDHPLVERARDAGARIVTEIGMTLRLLGGPVVGVTGTNGKSTTCSMAAAMLEASGVPVALGGNIGRPLLNEVAGFDPGTVAVLELSSFQLQWLEHEELRPAVGVVTNVSGDHFDRHPDFDHYIAAKRRLAEAVPPDGLLVLCADDPVCVEFGRASRAPVAWFGADYEPPIPLAGLSVPGPHNRANAAAAALAALAVGGTPEGCRAGAERYRPLPHRLEVVSELDGVLMVNDSVCTSPVATAAAVRSFERPVILLVGGRDKGLDRAPLLAAATEARGVVAYGETGPSLAARIPGAHLAGGFDEAVARARELARPGEVVLLSPGFASYDQFPSFDKRGERFRELARDPLASAADAPDN